MCDFREIGKQSFLTCDVHIHLSPCHLTIGDPGGAARSDFLAARSPLQRFRGHAVVYQWLPINLPNRRM